MATTKTDTIPKLTAKAQKVFNKYVRERDSENGYFTCISCGKTLPIEQMNAGHYIPQKNSSLLRFNEYNVHGECISDNGFNEFHLINYRKNLINKIGQEMVDWLEENQRTIKKWTRSELEEIIEKYK
jgi:phosphoketolase